MAWAHSNIFIKLTPNSLERAIVGADWSETWARVICRAPRTSPPERHKSQGLVSAHFGCHLRSGLIVLLFLPPRI
jgi:hypothetical protein